MEDIQIHQRIEKATGQCPDCGRRANYKIIRPPEDLGCYYWLVIDCPKCEYYEFTYQEEEELS